MSDSAIDKLVEEAMTIPGWLRADEAKKIVSAIFLKENPICLEIGSYLGRSAAVVAGALKLRRAGRLHCVDPFDCSGDEFSRPFYLEGLATSQHLNLLQAFLANVARLGLEDLIEVHVGASSDVAKGWTQPLDILLLDGDQSPEGACISYDKWKPFLKKDGLLILRNVAERNYARDHDGHYRLLKWLKHNYAHSISVDHFGSTAIVAFL